MTHNHDHDHHHDDKKLSDMDKLAHLLVHWQDHNKDHVENYRSWAEKAENEGQKETAALLRQAAEATSQVTDLFAQAREALG